MIKRYITLSLSIIVFVFYYIIAKNDGGPPYNTQAPGEKSCSGSEGSNGCHSGGIADNAGPGTPSIIFDNGNTTYIPGQTYIVKPKITHPSSNKFGFQIVSLRNSDNKNVGTITLIDTSKTRMQKPTWGSYQDRWYVMHRIKGTAPTAANTAEWTYYWKAPSTKQGDITFYAGFVAANKNDMADKGDQVYNTKLVVSPFNSIEEPSQGNTIISCYPNPTKGDVNVLYKSIKQQILYISVFNLEGKKVYHTSATAHAGENVIALNNMALSSGIYLLKLEGEGFDCVKRLVVSP